MMKEVSKEWISSSL